MSFSHFFIRRPIFAGVLSVVIFLVGLIAMFRLPISEYPGVVLAILIVEFAREKQHEGMGIVEAALEACKLRLRPVLMTSIAFIAGVFPLVKSHGAGAEMRQAMGVAVFAGMIGVTVFGLFLIPVFYTVIMRLVAKFAGKKAEAPAAHGPATGQPAASAPAVV